MGTDRYTTESGQPDTEPDQQDLAVRRARQRQLLAVLDDDVREPLLPFVEGRPAAGGAGLQERALRERVERIIEENPTLSGFLARSRRTRFARIRRDVIESRYLELAGDAPAGMDEELASAVAEIDPEVGQPSVEEGALLARIVPLMAWADHLASA